MIKVIVVIWGLVMVVPDGPPETDPQGMTVLFLNSEAWSSMHRHHPRYRQLGRDSIATRLPRGFDVVLGTSDKGAIDLTGLPHLAPPGDPGTVRDDCLRADSTCQRDGKPMVAGRVRFEGLWRTRPASRCVSWELPFDYRDEALYDFRPLGDLSGPGVGRDRLATALVMETEVDGLRELIVTGLLPRNHVLTESDHARCGDYVGSGARCFVIELVNAPLPLPVETACEDWPDPPARCRVDRHYAAFYDLLTVAPPWDQRPVPYVVDKYYRCRSTGGVGNFPSVRCPPYTTKPPSAGGGAR